MAIDWSINSGWEILTIISLVVGIVLAIMKIYDIVTKKRREKQTDILMEMEILSNLPKEAIIQFVNIELNYRYSKFLDLNFDIRNMGDYNTTVYINKINLSIEQSYRRKSVKSFTDVRKYDIGAKEKKTFIIKNFYLDRLGSVKKSVIMFYYSFNDSSGKKIDRTSSILPVRVLVPKI